MYQYAPLPAASDTTMVQLSIVLLFGLIIANSIDPGESGPISDTFVKRVQREIDHDQEDFENAVWKQLDDNITSLVFLTIEQEDEFVDLSILKLGKPFLPDIYRRNSRRWKSSSRPARKFTINDLQALVITSIKNDWISAVNLDASTTVNHEQYKAARQTLKRLLPKLSEVVRNPHADKRPLEDECTKKKTFPVYDFQTELLDLAEDHDGPMGLYMLNQLSKEFERTRLLHWSKALIGEFVAFALIHSFYCETINHFTVLNRHAEFLVDALFEADQYVLNNWNGEKLKDEVLRMANGPPPKQGIGHHHAIKEMLNKKYYWNSFRVHTYTNENGFMDNAEAITLRDDHAKYIPVPSHNYAVVVRWESNPYGEEKLLFKKPGIDGESSTGTNTPSQRPEPNTNTVGIAETGALGSQFVAPIAEAAGDVGDAMKKGGFKLALKVIGKVGKYLGPIAGTICSIISIFTEGNTAELQNAVEKGFHEMHQRLDGLETLIIGSKDEIKNSVQNIVQYYAEKTVYRLEVESPLNDLKKMEVEGTSEREILGEQDDWRSACNSNDGNDKIGSRGSFRPTNLLNKLSSHYFEYDLPDAFLKWAKDQSPREVQKVIFSLSKDAVDIGLLIVKGCKKVANPNFNHPGYRAKKSAEAARVVGKVLKKLHDAYGRYLNDWQDRPESGGDHITKAIENVFKNKNDEQKKRDAILPKLKTELAAKFKDWNFFIVYFSTKDNPQMTTPLFHWYTDPDYGRLTVKDNTYFLAISWNTEGLESQVRLPSSMLQNGSVCFKQHIEPKVTTGLIRNQIKVDGSTIKFALVMLELQNIERAFGQTLRDDDWNEAHRLFTQNYCCTASRDPVPGFTYKESDTCLSSKYDTIWSDKPAGGWGKGYSGKKQTWSMIYAVNSGA